MSVASPRLSAADAVWRVVVGAGCGGIVGALAVGPAARLLMFLLRLSSPDSVRGVTSDDGFVIGRFSADTIGLLAATAGLGAAVGAVYAVWRFVEPSTRRRLALWPLLAASVGGGLIVHGGGVDFTLLEPTWFAVGGFVVLPALGASAIALFVDRWGDRPIARDGRSIAIVAGAVAGFLGMPVVAVAAVGLLAVARVSPGSTLWRIGRTVGVVLLVAAIVTGTIDLVRDITMLT